MTKLGEKTYYDKFPNKEVKMAIDLNRPFTDPSIGSSLYEIGAVLELLPPPPAKLLDLGCGTGWTTCFFGKRGYHSVGVDISDDMIFLANKNKEYYQLKNINFMVSDYEEVKYQDQFDCAVFYSSLHHALDPEAALTTAFKALKRGGLLVISEPGVGHSKKHDSQHAIKEYDVTERDMPPKMVWAMGRKIGFRSAEFFPHGPFLMNLMYNTKESAKSKLLGRLLSVQPIKMLAVICFSIRNFMRLPNEGIVVLTK